jgi:lambda family phage portal protein
MIEKIIEIISPRWALERAKFRAANGVYKRQYEAAGFGRRTKNWRANSTSANQEVGISLVTLRNRSRDLCRNNPYGKRAVQCVANNVIGSGLMPSIIDATPKAEQKIKKLFFSWAKNCDFDNGLSLWFVQKLIIRTETESGECLIVKRMTKDKNAVLRLKIQVLEPDFLDHTKDGVNQNGSFIRFGIQFSKEGEREGYWLYQAHPGEGRYYGGNTQSVFTPASDVIHVYEVLRPGQVRGVPRGASVFIRMKDLDEYQDAELMRHKIAACFTVFVQRPLDQTGFDTPEKDDRLLKVEPGIIEYMQPGEQMTFASPPSGGGQREYTVSVLAGIAAGFGVTYEALSGDYSQVNFSSGRMGWIEQARTMSDLQENVVEPPMNKIWEWFNDFAILEGKLNKAYEVEWTKPRREMIDPKSEIKALSDAVRNGFMSWGDAVRSLGYDPDDVLREIAENNKKFDELKIILDSDARHGKASDAGRPPQATNPKSQEEVEEKD